MFNMRLRLLAFVAIQVQSHKLCTREKMRDMTNVGLRVVSMWRMSIGIVGGLLRKKIKIEHVMISS